MGRDEPTEPLVSTSTPDGALVLTDAFGGFVRVASGGAVRRHAFELPPGPIEFLNCEPAALAARPDGRLVVADRGCGRLVETTLGGRPSVRELGRDGPLRAAGPRRRIALVRGREHGDGRGDRPRRAADGTLTRFDVPRPPGELAAAPDGAVWAADDNACTLYRVSGDRLERRPAPFIVRHLRFTPDGSLWLAGHTGLTQLSPAELAAAAPPERCDTTGPRVTLQDRRGGRLSARTLRRRGLRLRADEAGHLDINVQPSAGGGTPRLIQRVLRRGRTLTLRLPAGWARAGASLSIGGTITDADGNYGDLPTTVKLGR